MPRSGIRQMVKPLILTIKHLYSILKKPRSRGISGALYLQPATAGVIFRLRAAFCGAAPGKWR